MLKLVVAYDGRRFAGSQRQPGRRTIQGELERACAILFGVQAPCRLAGRTDAGVHAVGQVAAVLDPGAEHAIDSVVRALNGLLPDDLAVSSGDLATHAFDPRRDARWREYRYRIAVGERQPFLRGLVLQRRQALDVQAMGEAARAFIGEHNFAAFAGMGAGTPGSAWQSRPRGTIRRVFGCRCRLVEERLLASSGHLIEVAVIGDAFLPRQVRGMVGALIDVGRGSRDPSWTRELLMAADRTVGPSNAPPDGLVLWAVGYGPFAGDPTNAESKKETDGSSHVHTEDRRHQA